MNKIIFEVAQDADGGFSAECLTKAIFTQGDSWQDLREQVKDAVQGFFFDRPKPETIHLRMVRDEIMAVA